MQFVHVASYPVAGIGCGMNLAMGTVIAMLEAARVFHETYPAEVVAGVLT
jgi:hypothetical protein